MADYHPLIARAVEGLETAPAKPAGRSMSGRARPWSRSCDRSSRRCRRPTSRASAWRSKTPSAKSRPRPCARRAPNAPGAASTAAKPAFSAGCAIAPRRDRPARAAAAATPCRPPRRRNALRAAPRIRKSGSRHGPNRRRCGMQSRGRCRRCAAPRHRGQRTRAVFERTNLAGAARRPQKLSQRRQRSRRSRRRDRQVCTIGARHARLLRRRDGPTILR